jgi:hypothetical protein
MKERSRQSDKQAIARKAISLTSPQVPCISGTSPSVEYPTVSEVPFMPFCFGRKQTLRWTIDLVEDVTIGSASLVQAPKSSIEVV